MSARHFSIPPIAVRLLATKRAQGRTAHASLGSSPDVQGLTLIECLVAIVVITITVVTITPGIFLATASRVQARRAEQANQIAQSEIDRIRGIVERGGYRIADLPPASATNDITQVAAANTVAVGTMLSPASCGSNYPRNPVANTSTLVPVDVDGDCEPEFAMQVFRTEGCKPPDAAPTDPPASFAVGVRVYSYNPNEGATVPTLLTERATLGVTAGRKDQGGSTRKPLQVLYSKASITNSENLLSCLSN